MLRLPIRFTSAFLAGICLLLCCYLGLAHDSPVVSEGKTPTNKISDRQLGSTFVYFYDINLSFTLDSNYAMPADSDLLEEVQDIARLTQIFYTRLLGNRFPTALQRVVCQFPGGAGDIHIGTNEMGRTTIAFAASLASTYRIAPGVPSPQLALTAANEFDRENYLDDFVSFANPGNFAPL